MRHRDAREGFRDVAELGIGGSHELAACGRVEEQIANFDYGAWRG